MWNRIKRWIKVRYWYLTEGGACCALGLHHRFPDVMESGPGYGVCFTWRCHRCSAWDFDDHPPTPDPEWPVHVLEEWENQELARLRQVLNG